MFDIEELVEQCRQALGDPEQGQAVREVVAKAVERPDELERALSGGAPGQTTYHQSPELTVQRIVWSNGVVSPPHEHRMWAVVGVFRGQEDNELWRRAPAGLERYGGTEVAAGEVILLGPDAVHAVSNPCHHSTIGFHVYGGDILTSPRREWDLAGDNEHLFDLAALTDFITRMRKLSAEQGREPDFDEVRQACLSYYGAGR